MRLRVDDAPLLKVCYMAFFEGHLLDYLMHWAQFAPMDKAFSVQTILHLIFVFVFVTPVPWFLQLFLDLLTETTLI